MTKNYFIRIIFLITCLSFSLDDWLQGQDGAITAEGDLVGTNENTKIDVYYYYEAKVSDVQRAASLFEQWDDFTDKLISKSASSSEQLLRSAVRKSSDAVRINKVYKVRDAVAENILSYKIHFVVPNGYDIYFRNAGSEKFSKGSFASWEYRYSTGCDSAEYIEMPEYIIMRSDEKGALPGKTTAPDVGDGEMQLALGFLPNGRSAGFISFVPGTPWDPFMGEGEGVNLEAQPKMKFGAANLRAVHFSEEVEIITQPFEFSTASGAGNSTQPYKDAPKTVVRQIITPQAIVDISHEEDELFVRYFKHDQRVGGRMTSEVKGLYGDSAVTYANGTGPFSFSGKTPFVEYRMASTFSSRHKRDRYTWVCKIHEEVSIIRKEGGMTENASINIANNYLIGVDPGSLETDDFPCEDCFGGWVECGCDFGRIDILVNKKCTFCSGLGYDHTTLVGCKYCREIGEWEEWETMDCAGCYTLGTVACGSCRGLGWVTAVGWGGGGISIDPAFGSNTTGEPIQQMEINGFGRRVTVKNYTYDNGRSWGEGSEGFSYGSSSRVDTLLVIDSATNHEEWLYEGTFPELRRKIVLGTGSGEEYEFVKATQKLAQITRGKGTEATKARTGYYRIAPNGTESSLYDTHHGRIKWQEDERGGWVMYDYANEVESLGQVTKIVRPYLDKERPAALPEGNSAAGYCITTMNYTLDWDGQKRVPLNVLKTIDGNEVSRELYTYRTEEVNVRISDDPNDEGQTIDSDYVWVAEKRSKGIGARELKSVSKIYKNGGGIAVWWLDAEDLPYSIERPDGTKESMAYFRGETADDGLFIGVNPEDGGGHGAFKSVVLKGLSAEADEGILVKEFDGRQVDDLKMVPRKSVAEVLIRDEQARIIRTETWLFKGKDSWEVIDRVDMKYDVAGNLIWQKQMDGTLYVADYTKGNNGSEAYANINFNNAGERTGRKQYERDENGVITKFEYDYQGRVIRSVRLAGTGVPAQATEFTYNDNDQLINTKMKAATGNETITSAKEYDTAGRLIREVNQGLETKYAYQIVREENGAVEKLKSTTMTLPNGGTKRVEFYRDGQMKSMTGTGVVPEYYTYWMEDDGLVTKKTLSAADGARWIETVMDGFGREIESRWVGADESTVSRVTSYNEKGRKERVQTGTLAATVNRYDAMGVLVESGLDFGEEALGRRKKTSYTYVQKDGAWWSYAENMEFPDEVKGGIVRERTWVRATEFADMAIPSGVSGVSGVGVSETMSKDANGNTRVEQVFVDYINGRRFILKKGGLTEGWAVTAYAGDLLVSKTSPSGAIIHNEYDGFGRLMKTHDRTSVGYAGKSVAYQTGTMRVVEVLDNKGVKLSKKAYDGAGQLVKESKPEVAYSGVGMPGVAGSAMAEINYAYDTAGRKIHVWGNGTEEVKYEYNDHGDVIGQTTFRGSAGAETGDKTVYVYNKGGALTAISDALGKTVRHEYTALGEVSKTTTARGVKILKNYDARTGELLGERYSDGTPSVSYLYDKVGRLKTVRDATGYRNFEYREEDMGLAKERFGWDAKRSQWSRYGTDLKLEYERGAVGAGVTTRGLSVHAGGKEDYGYTVGVDDYGRINQVKGLGKTYQYAYMEGEDVVTGVSCGEWKQVRSYEANRDLLSGLETKFGNQTLVKFGYKYDDLWRRYEAVEGGALYGGYGLGSGEELVVQSAYDKKSQLVGQATKVRAIGGNGALTELAGRRVGYEYDGMGNRKAELVWGLSGQERLPYGVNDLNQYETRKTRSVVGVSGVAIAGGNVTVLSATLEEFVVPETARWHQYYYGELPKEGEAGGYVKLYVLGTGGGYEVRHMRGAWTSPVDEVFKYDEDGNLVEDGLWEYAYDAKDQLVEMRSKKVDGLGVKMGLRFVYDYRGRRAMKSVCVLDGNGKINEENCRYRRLYVYEGNALVAEYVANGGTGIRERCLRSYIWGLDLIGGGQGGLLGVRDHRAPEGVVYQACYDGNGNVVGLARSDDGVLVAGYEYDGFGKVVRVSGVYGRENPLRYASKYEDEETGLLYYGYRYYNASLGRFINRDPIRENGGLNVYGFVGNNPVGNWDWMGLDPSGPVYRLPEFHVTGGAFTSTLMYSSYTPSMSNMSYMAGGFSGFSSYFGTLGGGGMTDSVSLTLGTAGAPGDALDVSGGLITSKEKQEELKEAMQAAGKTKALERAEKKAEENSNGSVMSSNSGVVSSEIGNRLLDLRESEMNDAKKKYDEAREAAEIAYQDLVKARAHFYEIEGEYAVTLAVDAAGTIPNPIVQATAATVGTGIVIGKEALGGNVDADDKALNIANEAGHFAEIYATNAKVGTQTAIKQGNAALGPITAVYNYFKYFGRSHNARMEVKRAEFALLTARRNVSLSSDRYGSAQLAYIRMGGQIQR